MPVFRSPSDYPWHFVIALYVVGTGLGIYLLGLDLIPQAWVIPPPNGLTVATGHFEPIKSGIKAPYHFVTTTGEKLNIGCLPESAMAACLDSDGLSLQRLSQSQVEIGYFHARNLRAPSLSNIVMTLSSDGNQLMTYDIQAEKLKAWSVREDAIKHSALSLGVDVFLPIVLLIFAAWLTIAKRKAVWGVPYER